MFRSGLLAIAISVAAAFSATVASAQTVSVSGTIAGVSDYRYRGISQTDRNPALQAGLTLNTEAGLYAGVWASNVDFNDNPRDTWGEIDLTLGFSNALSDALSYDVGFTYYAYPNSDSAGLPDYNYWETNFGIAYEAGQFGASGKIFYSPDFFGETGDAVYVTAGASYTPATVGWLTFDATLGHQWIENNAGFGTPDYFDWSIGATATWEMLAFGLRYIDTDIEKSRCGASLDWCDATAVASITASF